MSADLPLLRTESLDAPIAFHRGRAVAAREFIGIAEKFAAELPAVPHLVNLCENRFHFALAWTAACLREQLTLLPPSQAPGVLADLATAYPNQHTINDDSVTGFLDRASPRHVSALPDRWQIAAERIVALTFTSGSTGMPQAHPKTWGTLSRNAQLAAAEVLGGPGSNLVATVPAQHVYGLETSLISALVAGCPVYDGKPFFPQDVRGALTAVSAPRTLVTTPTHLKALIDANIQLPAVNRVVSATAPLPVELAQRIEAAWSTQVYEIYGCTEAGVMARRRTTEGEMWQTFTDGEVVVTDAGTQYRAPQLSEPVLLSDLIDSLSPTRFHLRGRSADMIKVAGKRTSLQEITRHLLAIAGVRDAAVFVPEPEARPAAFVVAPGLSTQQILAALNGRIEPVFVPRPLIMVDRLPRNDVGKLPRDALLSLWSRRHES
jgi:acyl-coenzyme A synthetase/AMP-(fatty) acid ligase